MQRTETKRQRGRSPLSQGYDDPVEQRIGELGELLALGLIRLRARMSSENSALTEESPLDFARLQSGDPDRSPKSKGRHA